MIPSSASIMRWTHPSASAFKLLIGRMNAPSCGFSWRHRRESTASMI